jgi:hypothetical protein
MTNAHIVLRAVWLGLAASVCAGAASAQTAASSNPGVAVAPGAAQTPKSQNLDLNVNSLPPNGGGFYDLNVAPTQNGPPGTIAMTNKAPPLAYTFDDIMRNTHGYVSTGVASNGGHEFSGGLFIPLVPGTADLAVGAGTGQVGGLPPVVPGGKKQTANYDTYYADLHLHPADNVDAYIGISGLHLKSQSPYGYGYGYPYPGP